MPLAALILLGFVLLFQYVTTRTRFGRHIYAVGGNDEAARRAGIKVDRVRIAVFMIASSMAAIGGIMAASRLLAVNQSSGGSDLLLLAIAGPVVAGTSLFGGRGSVWTALLGALRDPVDLERHGPARAAVVGQVHGHRRGAAARRDHRRARPAPAPGRRPSVTPLRGRLAARVRRAGRGGARQVVRMSAPLRVGLIGYGLAGSAFHAPLIAAEPRLALASVVTGNAERAARVAGARIPDARVLPDPTRSGRSPASTTWSWSRRRTRSTCRSAWPRWSAGCTWWSTSRWRRACAGARLLRRRRRGGRAAGRCPSTTAAGTRDALTLRGLLERGALGRVLRFESSMERWRPRSTPRAGASAPTPRHAGGVLFDLGPHLIDQALWLFGPAELLHAELRSERPGARGRRRRDARRSPTRPACARSCARAS